MPFPLRLPASPVRGGGVVLQYDITRLLDFLQPLPHSTPIVGPPNPILSPNPTPNGTGTKLEDPPYILEPCLPAFYF